MRVDFYLITKPRFRERPLLLVCRLIEKALAQTQPVVVLVRDAAQAEELDDMLWAYDEDAFIPHQIAGREDDAEVPVLIATPGTDTPPRPVAINLRSQIATGNHERVLEVVPADPADRKGSRQRWHAYEQAGAELHKHDM